MAKTNKELTAEITIALINARAPQVYRKNANFDGVTNSISLEGVLNVMDKVYEQLNTYKD